MKVASWSKKKKKQTSEKNAHSDVFRNGAKDKPMQNGVLFSIDSFMQSSRE